MVFKHSVSKVLDDQEYRTFQGVIFPAGARVFPAGNMEELTGNLPQNPRVNVAFLTYDKLI